MSQLFIPDDDQIPDDRNHEKLWWEQVLAKQEVLECSKSLWNDRSTKRRGPKRVLEAPPFCGPSDSRIPVIIVTGGIGHGRTTLVSHLLSAARRDTASEQQASSIACISHRYWQEYGVTPPRADVAMGTSGNKHASNDRIGAQSTEPTQTGSSGTVITGGKSPETDQINIRRRSSLLTAWS